MLEILLATSSKAGLPIDGFAISMGAGTNAYWRKYTYSTGADVRGPAVAAGAGTAGNSNSACGNKQIAVASMASSATAAVSLATNIFTYANETASAGVVLAGTARWNGAASSSATTGYFAGGQDNGGARNTTSKYAFAANTSVAGGNLSVTRYANAGAGGLLAGLFTSGYDGSAYTTSTSKYTYSSDVSTGGTNTRIAFNYSGTGNTTVAFFAGGYNASNAAMNTQGEYAYAGDTWTAGNNVLSSSRGRMVAVSTAEEAFLLGGSTDASSGTALSVVQIYAYASKTFSFGTSLSLVGNVGLMNACGASSTPGNIP
ncbi:hypothetical protein D3C71_79640 [compost metagenome]